MGTPVPGGWPSEHYQWMGDENQNPMTPVPIMPGGGNYLFKAEKEILTKLIQKFPDKVMLNEYIGECFLKYYDICRVESWPALGFMVPPEPDPGGRGFFTSPQRLLVGNQDKTDDPLPLMWIPMVQALVHEYVVLQDGELLYDLKLFHMKDKSEELFRLNRIDCGPVDVFKTGKLNEDGWIDFAVAGPEGNIGIFSCEGEMPLKKVGVNLCESIEDLRLEDVDLDGDMDMIARSDEKEHRYLINLGEWRFSSEH